MQRNETDVAVIGAGPYGLSLGAHLHHYKVSHRIFGRPMHSWQNHMPKGMSLKSDGYASTLYDPKRAFTLERYCLEFDLAYQSTGAPVPLDTFIGYGLEFQKRMVPQLEQVDIESVKKEGDRFLLRTTLGEELLAKRVVLAVGITHFAEMPEQLRDDPIEAVTHSYDHGELQQFSGKRVLVVGAGASAVDLAASLTDVQADVHIMGRRPEISFHPPVLDPRPLRERVLRPRNGLGFGWKYVLCVEAPLLFRALPQAFRHRIVRRHLGPSPGWYVRNKVVGRIPMHMSAQIRSVAWQNGRAWVRFDQPGKPDQEFVADHVIAATGYKPRIASLTFLDPALREQIRTENESPLLDANFRTSVPGLHMIGLASANCFGPAQRFAVGAKFATRHLGRYLARRAQRNTAPVAAEAMGASQMVSETR